MEKDKLIILQKKIDNKHLDSFWYEGNIANLGKYLLVANGDIEIYNKEGYRVFATGKHYADEVVFKDDKDLYKRVGGNYEDNLRWEHNNWFEVIDNETGECVFGDVCYDYDEGIKMLKNYYKEKIYEN